MIFVDSVEVKNLTTNEIIITFDNGQTMRIQWPFDKDYKDEIRFDGKSVKNVTQFHEMIKNY